MRPHAAPCGPMRPHAAPCDDPMRPYATPCGPMWPHAPGFSAGTPVRMPPAIRYRARKPGALLHLPCVLTAGHRHFVRRRRRASSEDRRGIQQGSQWLYRRWYRGLKELGTSWQEGSSRKQRRARHNRCLE
jgi:hypothetical protein